MRPIVAGTFCPRDEVVKTKEQKTMLLEMTA